ncbi:MAG: xanthine phosphoribosyltransferase [Gammaproteobacteria bacterium]|nr:xanthine phosphoribosyltransferase [Gammaproteobacteria bacterium]
MTPNKHFFVSWEEFHRDTRELARRLLPSDQWKGIVGITRGGLVPAAIIARELDIRWIDTVGVKSYTGIGQFSEVEMIKAADAGDGEGMILVDDLVDTGNTAKFVKEMLPKAHFVTVYAKPAGRPMVDDCIVEVPQETWINFPWDMALQRVTPLADA